MKRALADGLRKVLLAPVRLLLPRSVGGRIALGAIVVALALLLFAPALDVLLRLVEIVLRVLDPMLQSPVGRILVLAAFLAFVALAAWGVGRSRLRRWWGDVVVGRHLRAVAALALGDADHARKQLRRIARHRGRPARCPWVAADASLKLARDALARDRVGEALGWLERTREDGLPRELLASLARLRAEAWRRQGEVLPTQLAADLQRSVKAHPDDHGLACEARELARAHGAARSVAEAHERCVRTAPAGRLATERAAWIDALAASGADALRRGDFDAARAACKQLGKAETSGLRRLLLLGDLHAAEDAPKKALAAWGESASWEGLERAAALLASRPDCVTPRELVELLPMQGALLLSARELARLGDRAAAQRIARRAAQTLGPTPTVLRALGDLAQALGGPAHELPTPASDRGALEG